MGLLILFYRKKGLPILLLYPLLFFFLGTIHTIASSSEPGTAEAIRHWIPEKKAATISGKLLKAPETGNRRSTLLISADHLFFPDNNLFCLKKEQQEEGDSLIPCQSRPLKTRILLRMDGAPPQEISPGDPLLIRAVLSQPHRYGTKGSFDYPAYLARKSIHLQGWIKSKDFIVKLQASPASFPAWQQFLAGAEQIRQRINNFITESLPRSTAGLYRAILTGDREMVEEETLEDFKKTGIMHLLAISGVHMGLLALCCGLGFNFLVRRSEWLLLNFNSRKLVCILTLPILLFYALIAGLNPPVVRALIMTVIFFMAIINDRQHHLPTHISTAALIILIINPRLLFSSSFQLSFAAVIGIIIILPRVRELIKPSLSDDKPHLPKRLLHWLGAGLMVSVAAQLATIPLLLFYFNRFSLISPLTTLMAEPLICFWSLIIGLAGCPLIFFKPELAEPLFRIGGKGLEGADLITSKLAELPFAEIWLSTPSLPEISIYYLLLVAFCLKGRKTARYLVISLSASVLVLYPFYFSYRQTQQNYNQISFLDVGQGNSAVLEMGGGEIIVIDGGGPYSESFNVGKAVIAPYLWEKRIKRIDQLIISHLDSDHYNGLPFIVEHFQPDKIWLNHPKAEGSEATFNRLLEAARQAGSSLKVPGQGEILSKSPTSSLKNVAGLHLDSEYPEDNNQSLVLKLTSHGYSFLFPGDIEKKAEAELLAGGRDISTEILLAPHHGSISSSSEPFVRTADPDYTVISAGKYRDDSFPSPEVMRTYREQGSKVYNTALQGTVTFKTTNSGLKINTFKEN